MLKKILTVLALGALSVTSATAGGGDGCYLYKKDNFRGDELAMWGASSQIADFNSREGWNDEASSVRVVGSCSLMIYEHSNFRGAGVFVTPGIGFAKLGSVNGGFNDKASSAKCTCTMG